MFIFTHCDTFVPVSGLERMVINASSSALGTQPVDQSQSLAASLAAELDALRAEAMGWLPLDHGAYLHQGVTSKSNEVIEIQVVGVPDERMAAMNVLLLV